MSNTQVPSLVAGLLATPTSPQLGPGPRPGVAPLSVLQPQISAAIQALNTPPDRAELIRATILLWHDHHDPSHDLVQHIENSEGSYVHGLLHRREPDYGNAAYWFRRVGRHASFAALQNRIASMPVDDASRRLVSRLLPGGRWDAFAMIAACEEIEPAPEADAAHQFLRQIQQAEFETLLLHLCA